MIIAKVVRKTAQRTIQRARQWAAAPTPCKTCGKVRKGVQRVVGSPKR